MIYAGEFERISLELYGLIFDFVLECFGVPALLAFLLAVLLPEGLGVLFLFFEEGDGMMVGDFGAGGLELGRIGVGSIGGRFGFAFLLEIEGDGEDLVLLIVESALHLLLILINHYTITTRF